MKVHPGLKHYFGYCFYKAAMRYKALMEVALAEERINPSQLGMLRIIADMGAMSQNELGSGMGIDKASLAKWIDQLDRRGLVTRQESARDRRVKMVTITREGEKFVERLIRVRKRVEDGFLSRLSAEERECLRVAVPKLLL